MVISAPKGVEKRTSSAKKNPTARASEAGQAGLSISSASASKNLAANPSQSSEAGPLATPAAPAMSLGLHVSGAVPAHISHPTVEAASRETILTAEKLKPDQSRSQQESMSGRMIRAAKDVHRYLPDTSGAPATIPTTSTGREAHEGLAAPLDRAASSRPTESSMQVVSRGEAFHLERPRLVSSKRAGGRRSLPGVGGSTSRGAVADSISEQESTEIRRLYMSGHSARHIAKEMSTFKPGESAKPRRFSHNTIKRHVRTTNMNSERDSLGHFEPVMNERPSSRRALPGMTPFPTGGYVPRSLTTSDCEKIRDLHTRGRTQGEIAAEVGCCKSTVARYIKGQKPGTQNKKLKQDLGSQEEDPEAGVGPEPMQDMYEWLLNS